MHKKCDYKMILQTHFSVAVVSLFSTFVLHYSSSLWTPLSHFSYLNIEVWLPILPQEHYLWRIWIMSICPVHDVPVQSTVSWIRRGLAGSWPCFSGSVTSPVAGGLASGSTAAWLGSEGMWPTEPGRAPSLGNLLLPWILLGGAAKHLICHKIRR